MSSNVFLLVEEKQYLHRIYLECGHDDEVVLPNRRDLLSSRRRFCLPAMPGFQCVA